MTLAVLVSAPHLSHSPILFVSHHRQLSITHITTEDTRRLLDFDEKGRQFEDEVGLSSSPPLGVQINIPLCNAASKGDVKAFFKLLKKKEKIVPGSIALHASIPSSPPTNYFKATINDVNQQHQTPLHIVCTAGDYNFAKKIVKHKGVNINAIDKSGWSPLHCTCNFGFLELAKLLIESGADVTLPTSSKSTPLQYLARNCGKRTRVEEGYWLEVAKLMLVRGASPNDGNEHGITPLHEVASYGTETFARFLIENGANAAATNKYALPHLEN